MYCNVTLMIKVCYTSTRVRTCDIIMIYEYVYVTVSHVIIFMMMINNNIL